MYDTQIGGWFTHKLMVTLIVIMLALIVCGCISQSTVIITDDNNTTNTSTCSNTVIIDSNNTKVSDDAFSMEQIDTGGIYEIKGRVVKIALNSDVLVFTYSSGNVVSYQNAQAFPWKPNMKYDIIANQEADGFHITQVSTY
jgi:hypothetical protein